MGDIVEGMAHRRVIPMDTIHTLEGLVAGDTTVGGMVAGGIVLQDIPMVMILAVAVGQVAAVVAVAVAVIVLVMVLVIVVVTVVVLPMMVMARQPLVAIVLLVLVIETWEGVVGVANGHTMMITTMTIMKIRMTMTSVVEMLLVVVYMTQSLALIPMSLAPILNLRFPCAN